MSILVFNAGSSSLKFGLFGVGGEETLATGHIDWADGNRHAAELLLKAPAAGTVRLTVDVPDDRAATCCAIESLAALSANGDPIATIDVVGHRVVHGGAEFPDGVLIDARVQAIIARLAELAPLHNPPALAAIRAAEAILPHAAQVAVFDTAFYAHLPPRAYVYPLPYEWYEKWGVRRFGFHGISQKYCTRRAAELLGCDLAQLRIVSCHLGGGASAVAVEGGRAVATTMGFTPLEGLMMGTRSGSIDPGILLHMQRCGGLTVDAIDDVLNHRSGLLGVSGLSPDFAHVEEAARQGNPRAELARQIFADRVRSTIGALAVTMGGVDVLIFTDRVGENSPGLRAAACRGLECLGLQLDPQRNAACQPDCDIAAERSSGRILVLHTREEQMIARDAWRVAGIGHPGIT
jgi:acetate kinase